MDGLIVAAGIPYPNCWRAVSSGAGGAENLAGASETVIDSDRVVAELNGCWAAPYEKVCVRAKVVAQDGRVVKLGAMSSYSRFNRLAKCTGPPERGGRWFGGEVRQGEVEALV